MNAENTENHETPQTEFDIVLAVLEEELSGIEARLEVPSIVDWYMGKLAAIEARRELAKSQLAVILKQLDNEQASLVFLAGGTVREQVIKDIAEQAGKKKSKDYLQGRAGMRKIATKLAFDDEDLALAWAEEHAPEAVKITKSLLKMPLNEMFRAEGIIPPGSRVEAEREKFYPVCDVADLPAATVRRLARAELARLNAKLASEDEIRASKALTEYYPNQED